MVRLAVLCLAWMLLGSCGRRVEGPERTLPAPVLLPAPDDLATDERGIDAVPEKDAIRVEWVKYEDENARIGIYRSAEEPVNFVKIVELSAKDSAYLDEDIAIGVRYWYFAVARRGDVLSAPSDTVSYKLLEKPFALSNTVEPKPVFRWEVDEIPVGYVVKLFQLPTDNRVWFAVVSPGFAGLTEEVRFNFDGSAIVDSLASGVTYRWRVDVIGPESNAGAESNWRTFVCP